MKNPFPFQFGINTLDELININTSASDYLDSEQGLWTASIQGPDGCGKSILSLHLASKYWLNNQDKPIENKPRIVYISTDLAYHQAKKQWEAFGLGHPKERIPNSQVCN
jgi:predicted NACHT family NTPase